VGREAAIGIALAVAAACCVSPAYAVLDTDGPNGPLTFTKQVSAAGVSWSMTGVPDIDQARGTNGSGTKVGLPNNGSWYCVPTTGMDFLAYLADRGFAGSLGVPSKDWTLPAHFNEMSVLLAQLGGEMGTDPQGGTGGDGFVAAMTKRLAKSEIGVVQTYYYVLDSQGGEPTVADVIESGADGDLLAAGIGKYQDEESGGKTLKRRVGGHAFAIVGGESVVKGSKSGTVFTRDPATVYVADTNQGEYTTDAHSVSPVTADFVYEDDNGVDQTYTAERGKWDGSSTTLFEGFTRILPKTTWIGAGKQLERVIPFELIPDPGPLKNIFEVPGDGSVKALALSAATNAPAFLVNGSNNVYELDPLSGESKTLMNLKGARALTFGGPAQRLYIAGSEKLLALNRAGHIVDSKKLSAPIQALDFDEANGRLGGISNGKLLLFNSKLDSLGTRALPAVQKKGSGTPLLAFGPNGGLVLGKAGQGKLFQGKANVARRAGASAVKVTLKGRQVQGGGKVHGLAVDDLGNVIVSVGGKLRVFGPGGRRLMGSPFEGASGDNVLAVTRSFDNTAGTPFLETLDFTVEGPPPLPPPEEPPPPPPPDQPDLVISGLQNSSSIVVKNVGKANAGPFDVMIHDAVGRNQTVRFDNGLAAGDQAAVPSQTCMSGRTFAVDSANEVAESNEGNNTHSCT